MSSTDHRHRAARRAGLQGLAAWAALGDVAPLSLCPQEVTEVRIGPRCGGGEFRIVVAIVERPVIENILAHLGLDVQLPPKGRARGAEQDFAV